MHRPPFIIIKSFYSLWSTGHPWRVSKRCDLQLSPWPRSMISLCFLFHPLLSFATFSSAYLFLYIPEDFNLMRFSLFLLLLYVNVCPIQFFFLLFIWISIGFCLVILHSSSFVNLSVHFLFIIRLKPAAFTARKHSWCSFLLEAESRGHSAAGKIMAMKKSKDTISNRTRNLPACSAVPQPSHRIPQETDNASDYYSRTEGPVKHHTHSTTVTNSKEKLQHNA